MGRYASERVRFSVVLGVEGAMKKTFDGARECLYGP